MLIKVNQSELEVYENSDIYVGLPDKGQSFKKWDECQIGTKKNTDRGRKPDSANRTASFRTILGCLFIFGVLRFFHHDQPRGSR
jgi:hypothetical protein